MALIVSSTTDTQEAVNAAAGIAEAVEPEAPEAARHPETPVKPPVAPPQPKPTPAPEPEEDEEPGEEPAAEEDAQAKPKKTGGFQRKIEKLERQLEYERWARERQESEYRRAQPPPQQQQPQQPAGPPRQEQFETYEQFIDAVTDYKLEQALAKRAAIEQRERQQQAQQQVLDGWHQRVGQFKTTNADFDDALESVSHIAIPPVLGHALMSSEEGPRLAYELARQPEMLGAIVRLDPLAQLRALGKFEASLAAAVPVQAAPPRKPSVSQAPPPIRPVGQGASNGSTVPLDQLDYQAYKRARQKQEAARRSS